MSSCAEGATVAAVVAALAGAALAACSSSSSAGRVDPPPLVTGGPYSSVRFAHLAPALGAVDFCGRRTGDLDYQGPLLATVGDMADAGAAPDGDAPDTGADAAAAQPLAYQTFAVPMFLPADGVDLVAIPAGALCDAAPLASASFPTLAGTSTIVLTSRASDATVAQLFAVADDSFSLDSDAPYLRVVNAALLDAPQDLAATVTVDGTSVSLGSDVALGGASPAIDGVDGAVPPVTASGYVAFAATPSVATLALTFASSDGGGVAPGSIALGEPLVAQRLSTAYVGHDAQGLFVALSDDSTVDYLGSSWQILR